MRLVLFFTLNIIYIFCTSNPKEELNLNLNCTRSAEIEQSENSKILAIPFSLDTSSSELLASSAEKTHVQNSSVSGSELAVGDRKLKEKDGVFIVPQLPKNWESRKKKILQSKSDGLIQTKLTEVPVKEKSPSIPFHTPFLPKRHKPSRNPKLPSQLKLTRSASFLDLNEMPKEADNRSSDFPIFLSGPKTPRMRHFTVPTVFPWYLNLKTKSKLDAEPDFPQKQKEELDKQIKSNVKLDHATGSDHSKE